MSRATNISKVANTGVPTRDQARALAFYSDTLGFELRRDQPFGPGLRWLEVAPAGADTTVALLPTPPDQPVGVDTAIRLSTTDADADHAALKAKGVDVDGEVMRWEGVPPMFTFRDSEGNTLYVVEGA